MAVPTSTGITDAVNEMGRRAVNQVRRTFICVIVRVRRGLGNGSYARGGYRTALQRRVVRGGESGARPGQNVITT